MLKPRSKVARKKRLLLNVLWKLAECWIDTIYLDNLIMNLGPKDKSKNGKKMIIMIGKLGVGTD